MTSWILTMAIFCVLLADPIPGNEYLAPSYASVIYKLAIRSGNMAPVVAGY